MKIVVFEPHPDDLLFGPGPILLEWIEEGKHDIQVITITDGRACYRASEDSFAPEVSKMTEDEVADMRIMEAKKAVEFIGLPQENLHLLKFHDADGQKYVKTAIEKVIPLIKDANRLVIPSDRNRHVDHQATHDIAIGAAKKLRLKEIEYLVYFVPSYGKWNEDSKIKQFIYEVDDQKAKFLDEWLDIYQSQAKLKFTWKMYKRFIKKIRVWTYAVYRFDEIGKYFNF